MKTRMVTIISIAGVLVAGTAAAMVNTQIFESEPVAGESAVLLAPEPTTVALTPGVDASSAPSSNSASAATGQGPLTEFAIGEAGFVTVDVINDRLRIVSVDPSAGWSVVEQEEYPAGDHVEVTLASDSMRIEFEADLVNGRIVPELESSALTNGASRPSTSDDDFDDDGFDDDGFDDDGFDDDDLDDDDGFDDDDRFDDDDDDDEYDDDDNEYDDDDD